MRKADDLREWLVRTIPDLHTNPDKLKTYLSNGRLDFQRGASLSFGYRYELELVLENFTASLDNLFVPLIIWLAKNEPALIDQNERGVQWIVDVLDHSRSDIQITLPLREVVIVQDNPEAEGGFIATHPPAPAFPAVFEGAENSLLSHLFMDEFSIDRFLAASSDDADDEA